MATTSTVPTFKTALIAALQARSGLQGVTIAYAWPGPTSTAEMVALGRVEDSVDIPIMKAGRRHRDEDYTLDVVIWCSKPGSTPLKANDVEARAYEIKAELEDLLAESPQLITEILWAEYAGHDSEFVPLDKGWAWQLTARVRVRARLN